MREGNPEHARRLAGAAAGDHFRPRGQVEERQQPSERRCVEAAKGLANRLADGAEDGLAQIDPGRVLLLDVDYTNNSKTLEPRGGDAATKWSLKWVVWLQDCLLSWAALV